MEYTRASLVDKLMGFIEAKLDRKLGRVENLIEANKAQFCLVKGKFKVAHQNVLKIVDSHQQFFKGISSVSHQQKDKTEGHTKEDIQFFQQLARTSKMNQKKLEDWQVNKIGLLRNNKENVGRNGVVLNAKPQFKVDIRVRNNTNGFRGCSKEFIPSTSQIAAKQEERPTSVIPTKASKAKKKKEKINLIIQHFESLKEEEPKPMVLKEVCKRPQSRSKQPKSRNKQSVSPYVKESQGKKGQKKGRSRAWKVEDEEEEDSVNVSFLNLQFKYSCSERQEEGDSLGYSSKEAEEALETGECASTRRLLRIESHGLMLSPDHKPSGPDSSDSSSREAPTRSLKIPSLPPEDRRQAPAQLPSDSNRTSDIEHKLQSFKSWLTEETPTMEEVVGVLGDRRQNNEQPIEMNSEKGDLNDVMRRMKGADRPGRRDLGKVGGGGGRGVVGVKPLRE